MRIDAPRSSLTAFTTLTLVVALAACSGGGDPAPPSDNHPTVAAFTASATAQAMTAIAFDASASSDPDGDGLSFSWDFGDGERGGAGKIAHLYAKASSFTVKLTVGDGKGGLGSAQKTVVVSSAGAAGISVNVTGVVADVSDPLAGVTVQDVGGAVTGTTDSSGKVTLALTVGAPHALKLSEAGYADQFQPVSLAPAAVDGSFKAGMMLRQAAQSLDATVGGELAGKDGSRVTLPAGGVVDANGNAVTGAVQISQSPVDVSGQMISVFPGQFAGVKPDATSGGIASFGTVEFALQKNGQRLQLAPGKTATIEIPVYTTLNMDGSSVNVGDSSALWSLSEQTGLWVQEGTGVIVSSSASPTGLALRGAVSHFSWWNSDVFLVQPYLPKPRSFINPGPEFQPIPSPCSIGPKLPGEYQTQAANGLRPQEIPVGFVRPPGYSVKADIPVGGGFKLTVPANMDFTLHACSTNGLYCGDATVHGASGASDDVNISLNPLTSGGSCASPTAISAPLEAGYSLVSGAQASCFSLAGQAGQVLDIFVKRTLNSTLSGSVAVLGAGAQILKQAEFGAQLAGLEVVLPTSGAYQIKVSGSSGAAGGYHLSLASTTPTPIALEPPIQEQLEAGVNAKFYSVSVQAGDRFSIVGREANQSQLQVRVLGLGLDAQTIQRDAYPINLESSSGGAYTFKVSHGNHADAIPFRLTVQKALPLTPGTPVSGGLPSAGDVRVYAFHADAGALLNAIVKIPSSTAVYPFSSFLRVGFSGANGGFSASSNLSPAQTGAMAIQTGGTFWVAVSTGLELTEPNFTLGVALLQPPAPLSLTLPITTTAGALETLGAIKPYSLNLTAKDEVKFVLSSPGPLFASLRVFGPGSGNAFQGAPLLPEIGLYSVGSAASDVFVAPTSGQYVVAIGNPLASSGNVDSGLTANASGNFTFTLLRPNAAPITPDAASLVSTALNTPFGFDRYALNVANAGYYNLVNTLTGPQALVYRRLRDADGAIVGQGDGLVKLNAGSYWLEMDSQNASASSYALNVTTIEAPPLPIATGAPLSGAIDSPGERDFYGFTGAGAPVTITVTPSAGLSGGIVIRKRFTGGEFYAGTQVTFQDFANPIKFTPIAGGEYVIEVTSQNPNTGLYSTGGYGLALN